MEKKERAESEEEEFKDESFIERPAILDKYKAAALITNAALDKVISLCVPGADIYAVCQEGDKFMEEELKKVFTNKKSKKLERGIAFPTCISVNNILGHYSPMADESSLLVEGDLAKIDLGCHLDGFVAQAAHTIIVSVDPNSKVTGKKAEVTLAAYNAMMAAQRLIKEAGSNQSVTDIIAAVCAQFGTTPVEGVLSHKMKKHLIDGNDVIINKETPEQKVEDYEFMPGDVFDLDIFVSSGEGKPKESEFRTTVYKRELDAQYNLKSKNARAFFTEVNKKYPTLPFSIRAFQDSTGAKIGVTECLKHDLLNQYPVYIEKPGEFVAQFKCTIVVQQRSTVVLAGKSTIPVERFETEKRIIDEELNKIISSELWKKEEKKKATVTEGAVKKEEGKASKE